MFGFLDSATPTSRMVVSQGDLPGFIDPRQPPSKKKPFSAIIGQDFTHTVELLLPEELFNVIWSGLVAKIRQTEYSQVIMPLSALLEGDFFNLYIKSGNIMMVSEGRPGIDDKYTLKDGTLRLELAKENYERSGLLGKAISDGGRKHMETRFAVEIDLRQPSMLHGKKGFERIVWAFKNVLNHSVTWLFYDWKYKSEDESQKPIAKHHPVTKQVAAHKTKTDAVLVFDLLQGKAEDSNEDFEEWAFQLYEWLSLISIESPRVNIDDSIDPYLCRYQIPSPQADLRQSQSFIKITWHGLVPHEWTRTLFVELA